MKKISKIKLIKHKKEIESLYALGYRYDNEKDPEKSAAMKDETIARCEELKIKLGLTDCSAEETQGLLGITLDMSEVSNVDFASEQGADKEID